MRRWLLAGAGLLLIAAGVFVYAVTRLDQYLNAQRPQLQAAASALIGRVVTFDTIGVSVRSGISASVTNLAVADDARFGDAPFLTAARAEAVLELFPALRGEYRIRRVVLRQPNVTLQRDAQGWNAWSLMALDDDVATAPATLQPSETAPAVAGATRLPASVLWIAAANIEGGTVRLIDHTQQPPLQLEIDQLHLRAHDLAVGRPVAFDVSAALLQSQTPNLTLRGHVEPGTPPIADVDINWRALDVATLASLLPWLAGTSLGGTVSGDLHVHGALTPTTPPLVDGTLQLAAVSAADARLPARLENLTGSVRCSAGNAELSDATAQLGAATVTLNCRSELQDDPTLRCDVSTPLLAPTDLGIAGGAGDVAHDLAATIETRPLATPFVVHVTAQIGSGQIDGAVFRQLALDATGGPDSLSVERISLQAFEGTIAGDGACRVVKAATASCSGHVTAAGLQMAALLASQHSPAAQSLSGRLSAEARVSSSGENGDALRDNLRGSAQGALDDGILRHVNLAQQIVGALPGIGGLIDGPRAKALLNSSETHFDSATATVQIAARHVTTDDAQIRSSDFSARLRGSGTFDGQLAGKGSFTLSPELAREVIQRVPILDSLKTDNGITVPFFLSGTLEAPRVRPDTGGLPKALARDLTGGIDALLQSPDAARAGKDLKHGLGRLLSR